MMENEAKLEPQLFKAADKLRNNIDAAEYKHIVLGLMFLKYLSASLESLPAKIKKGKGDYEPANPEEADEYNSQPAPLKICAVCYCQN